MQENSFNTPRKLSFGFRILICCKSNGAFLSQGYIGRKNVDLEDVKNKSWT